MKKSRGFTLIELLIVVAIIGIIAAIAIPNLLNAVQRGKQKRTMGDIRTTSTAVEAYAVDNNQYVTKANYTATADLATSLETTYIKKVPLNDGWNTPIGYKSANGQDYTVYSGGKNKNTENNPDSVTAGTQTKNFNCDIVFSTGSFVVWPEGSQN